MGNINKTSEVNIISSELISALKDKPYLIKDINYGDNVKIIRLNNDDQKYAIKRDDFYSEDEFYAHLYSIKIRMHNYIQMDNFVSVSEISVKSKNHFCTNQLSIYSKYEYFDKSLRTYLENYQKNGILKRIDKAELFYIISTVIEALQKLENSNIFHGNIRPDTILIDKLGTIKLTDSAFMLKENSYQSYLFGKYDKFYVCPAILKNLRAMDINPKINYEKSNIFSLGLTILETMTLCDVNLIYNLSKNEIKTKKLEEFIIKAGKLYDEDICHLLKKMLNIKKGERSNYENILEYTRNFENSKIDVEKLTMYENLNLEKLLMKNSKIQNSTSFSKNSNLETTYQSKMIISIEELKNKNQIYSSMINGENENPRELKIISKNFINMSISKNF